MTAYHEALCEAMTRCHAAGAVFMGQSVRYPGTAMYSTLSHLPEAARVELPVAEEMQLGMALGAALDGTLVVSCFPRINFLLLAINQLVNHADKLCQFSNYKPRLIIRTAVASSTPLNPGPQHLGNYTNALRDMCSTVEVVELLGAWQIGRTYEDALSRQGVSLIVEHLGMYG